MQLLKTNTVQKNNVKRIKRYFQKSIGRVSYNSDKQLAETGNRIEKGESVSPLCKLDKDHCLWILTTGGGMGKFLWR